MTSSRVRYREGQTLKASDLAEEQAYHLAMGRHHNIGAHGWGIVMGLALLPDPDSDQFWLEPGMAIDGFGRELLVPEPVLLAASELENFPGENIDVWLLYRREAETVLSPAGPGGQPPQANRWRELAVVGLTSAGIEPADWWANVDPSDRDFSPDQLPPDDPAWAWPVYLGRLWAPLGFLPQDIIDLNALIAKLNDRENELYRYLFRALWRLQSENFVDIVNFACKIYYPEDAQARYILRALSRFQTRDFKDLTGLVHKLQDTETYATSRYLRGKFLHTTRTLLNSYEPASRSQDIEAALIYELNRILLMESLDNEPEFMDIRTDRIDELYQELKQLKAQNSANQEIQDLIKLKQLQLNRLLLEAAYPDEINTWPPSQAGKPKVSPLESLLDRLNALLLIPSLALDYDRRRTVVEGDTLRDIAREMYGEAETWPRIHSANPVITDPDLIFPDMELFIPPLTVDEHPLFKDTLLAPGEETRQLFAQWPQDLGALVVLNRRLLEDFFPDEINPFILFTEAEADSDPDTLRMAWVERLNYLLIGPSLYHLAYFRAPFVELRQETRDLIEQNPEGLDRVYLNRLLLEDAFPDSLKRYPSSRRFVDIMDRPYVYLLGEAIIDPANRAQMLIGGSSIADPRRFAVSLPNGNGTFTDHLLLDKRGNTTLRGNTAITGDLIIGKNETENPEAQADGSTIQENSIKLGPGLTFEPMRQPPQQAMPWQIYRTPISSEDQTSQQLRLEISYPVDEDDPARYALVIGGADGSGGFIPYLVVKPEGIVEIRGELRVAGQVVEGPIEADPDDPRFEEEFLEKNLIQQWLQALTKAGEEVDLFYDIEFQAELAQLQNVEVGATLAYNYSVRNLGARGAIENIQIAETLLFDSETVHRQARLIPELGQGGARSFSGSYNIPDDEALAGRLVIAQIRVQGVLNQEPVHASSEVTAIMAGANLAVDITNVDPIAIIGQEFPYNITVRNIGNQAVNTIDLIATLTVGEETLMHEENVGTIPNLARGASATRPITYRVPTRSALIGQRLRIHILARGNRPVGGVTRASGRTTALIDGGTLEIALAAPDIVVISQQMAYAVTVTNSGRGIVTDIRINGTLEAGGTVIGPREVAFISTLGIDASRVITVNFPNSDLSTLIGQNLSITAEAIGFRQAGSQVQATATTSHPQIDAGNLNVAITSLPEVVIVEEISSGSNFAFIFTVTNSAGFGNVTIGGVSVDLKVGERLISPTGISFNPNPAAIVLHPTDPPQEISVNVSGIGDQLIDLAGEKLGVMVTVRGQRQADSAVESVAQRQLLIDGGRLVLEAFEITTPPIVGQLMQYRVRVKNNGESEVKNVVFKDLIAIVNGPPPLEESIRSIAVLSPGSSEEFFRPFLIPPDLDLAQSPLLDINLIVRGKRQAGTALPEIERILPAQGIGLLAITISFLSAVTAGQPMNYSIRATNSGSRDVANIMLHVDITHGVAPAPGRLTLPVIPLIAFGESEEISRTYNVPPGARGRLSLQVTVEHNGIQRGNPVQRSAPIG